MIEMKNVIIKVELGILSPFLHWTEPTRIFFSIIYKIKY